MPGVLATYYSTTPQVASTSARAVTRPPTPGVGRPDRRFHLRHKKQASGWHDAGNGNYQWVEGGKAQLTHDEARQDAERVMWLAVRRLPRGQLPAGARRVPVAPRQGLGRRDAARVHGVLPGAARVAPGGRGARAEGAAVPAAEPAALPPLAPPNDENKLMVHHQKLADTTLDQLSLASIHFLRNHFQEATDIYKRLLLENRDYTALNVYVALCYYKLDYYDVSLEILAAYLQAHPDSPIALNLKACNQFRLYDGKAAEAELAPLTKEALSVEKIESKLVRHNMVVFQNGERALQILPPLVGVVPEARLNLVIYHMHHGEVQEAFELMKDIEPSSPQEYILKGVTNLALGQAMDSREHLKVAQQYFQLLGASASECDTIPGRQCMASCFFILRQFDDVLIYLSEHRGLLPLRPDLPVQLRDRARRRGQVQGGRAGAARAAVGAVGGGARAATTSSRCGSRAASS